MFQLIDIARATALAGLVSGCVALSAPALAAENDGPPQGALALRGADFTSPAAVAHLQRQLRHVAMDICMPNSSGRMVMNRSEQACYDTAVKDGLAQIDSRQQQALRERIVRLADTKGGNISAQ